MSQFPLTTHQLAYLRKAAECKGGPVTLTQLRAFVRNDYGKVKWLAEKGLLRQVGEVEMTDEERRILCRSSLLGAEATMQPTFEITDAGRRSLETWTYEFKSQADLIREGRLHPQPPAAPPAPPAAKPKRVKR